MANTQQAFGWQSEERMTLINIQNAISSTFARFIFDRKTSPVPMGVPEHILVIRWDAKLGDSFVSSFFYREIKKLVATKVTVATTKELAELHMQSFGADHVVISCPRPGLRKLISLRSQLTGIDTVVHLVGKIQPSEIFFLWLLKPKHVFSLDDDLGWVDVKMGRATEERSFSEKYRYVLERLGIRNICNDYIIPIPSASALETAGSARCDIVFNPFGSRPDKSLSTNKSVQVLRYLAEIFPERRIGILNSPQTRAESIRLAERVARDNVAALDYIVTIQDTIAAICTAEAVISVDTAIVHIASALDRKLLAIYPLMDDEHNPWLPPVSPLTHIIYSRQNVVHYHRTGIKNMNNFDDGELIEKLQLLLKNITLKDQELMLEARIVSGLHAATRNLALQLPIISQNFPEVAGCYRGTINLQLEQPFTIIRPDHRTAPLAWVPDRPRTEVFEFVRIRLELPNLNAAVPAWLYIAHRSPHRKTPVIHEIIAAQLDIAGITNCRIRIPSAAIALGSEVHEIKVT